LREHWYYKLEGNLNLYHSPDYSCSGFKQVCGLLRHFFLFKFPLLNNVLWCQPAWISDTHKNKKICNGPSNDKVQRNLQLTRKQKWHRNNVEFLNDNIFTKFCYSDLKEDWNGENLTDWGIWEGDFIVTRAKKSSILPCLVSPDKKYKLQPFIGLLTIHNVINEDYLALYAT
jgi:hypothetical protein